MIITNVFLFCHTNFIYLWLQKEFLWLKKMQLMTHSLLLAVKKQRDQTERSENYRHKHTNQSAQLCKTPPHTSQVPTPKTPELVNRHEKTLNKPGQKRNVSNSSVFWSEHHNVSLCLLSTHITDTISCDCFRRQQFCMLVLLIHLTQSCTAAFDSAHRPCTPVICMGGNISLQRLWCPDDLDRIPRTRWPPACLNQSHDGKSLRGHCLWSVTAGSPQQQVWLQSTWLHTDKVN